MVIVAHDRHLNYTVSQKMTLM